jgi:PAS domain S-box-containing protein
LRGSRRASRERPPLLRNETSDQFDETTLELPAPVSIAEERSEVRILHVDDNPEILEVTKLFLERTDDAFTVVGKQNAVEAINCLQEDEFDCLISDYEMPTTDGLELLEIVREQYPDLPFILYTAHGSEEIASEAISAGVTEYMQKETSNEQYEVLANRVRNAVDRYRSQQQFWDALSWYHRIIEQDLAGVFILQDREFVYVNERMADLFGCMQSELLGEPPHCIADGSEDEAIFGELEESIDDPGFSFTREFTGSRADDTPVSVELRGGSIRYDGDPACVGVLWPSE